MDISFKFDPEALVGADTLSMAGAVCARHGRRIMVAADHGLDTQIVSRIKSVLEDSGLNVIVFDGIEEDSDVTMAENIAELSRAGHCDAVVGFGGRKTQVIARMIAIIAPMKISAFELLDGRMFQNKFLPFISIPTDGLDAFSLTEYFVAADPRNNMLKSIQCPANLFSAMIIDSTLFKVLSGKDAAAYVLDGFSAALDAYCSAKANFLSDVLLEKSLNLFSRLLKSGTASAGINADVYAQACFLASIGNSASSPGAGAALSYALSLRFPVSKQQCSAAILPYMAEKLAGARPEKMARAAALLSGAGKAASVAEAANSAAGNIRRCMEALNVPADLKAYNIPIDRVTAAVEAGRNLEFVANSPWTVSGEEVFEIMRKIL